MKRLLVILAAILLAGGAAQAQTVTSSSGGPIDLRSAVAAPPRSSHTAPARARVTPVSVYDINPTAGPQTTAPRAATPKHKKTVQNGALLREPTPALTVPPPVHAKATHSHPVHAAKVHKKTPVRHVAMASPPAAKPAHHRHMAAADPRGSRGDEHQRSDALNDLSAHGYADYKDFHREGDRYVATVNRNGAPVTLTADPRTHQVTASP